MNEEWNDWALHQINIRASTNREYQQIRESYMKHEAAYLEIAARLSQQDRERIEDYIAMCENLEYMRTQIAYEFGKEVGRKQASLTVSEGI